MNYKGTGGCLGCISGSGWRWNSKTMLPRACQHQPPTARPGGNARWDQEPGPLSSAGRQELTDAFSSLSDHVLYSGEGHLHPGLQCLSDFPYNRKHNSLPLQVSSRNEQSCQKRETGNHPFKPSRPIRGGQKPLAPSPPLCRANQTPWENASMKYDANVDVCI